jgi:hypothetical protein
MYTAPVVATRFQYDPITLSTGLFLFNKLEDVRMYLTENHLQGLGLVTVPAEVIENLNWEDTRRTPCIVTVPVSSEVPQAFHDFRRVLSELIVWNLHNPPLE